MQSQPGVHTWPAAQPHAVELSQTSGIRSETAGTARPGRVPHLRQESSANACGPGQELVCARVPCGDSARSRPTDAPASPAGWRNVLEAPMLGYDCMVAQRVQRLCAAASGSIAAEVVGNIEWQKAPSKSSICQSSRCLTNEELPCTLAATGNNCPESRSALLGCSALGQSRG